MEGAHNAYYRKEARRVSSYAGANPTACAPSQMVMGLFQSGSDFSSGSQVLQLIQQGQLSFAERQTYYLRPTAMLKHHIASAIHSNQRKYWSPCNVSYRHALRVKLRNLVLILPFIWYFQLQEIATIPSQIFPGVRKDRSQLNIGKGLQRIIQVGSEFWRWT